MAHGTTSLFSSTIYALSDAATQFSKAAHKVRCICLLKNLWCRRLLQEIFTELPIRCRVLLHLHSMTMMLQGWRSSNWVKDRVAKEL